MIRQSVSEHLLHNAGVLSRLSRAAYLEPQHVLSSVGKIWPNVVPFSEGAAQGFVCWNDRLLVVSIRGTTCFEDLLHDIRVNYTYANGLRVHSGFLEHARLVRRAVEAITLPAGLQAVFTGHSLGGAAATLLGIEPPANVSPHFVVTFGAPRCLSPDASGRYVYPILYRFVRCCDPVPDVPYRRLGVDYSHAGAVLVVKDRGHVEGEGCATWSRWMRRLRYFWYAHRGQLASAIAKDHAIATYESYLAPFVRESQSE